MFESFKFIIFFGLCSFSKVLTSAEHFKELNADNDPATLYTIEGTILPPEPELIAGTQWPADIKLSIDDGNYQGFVRRDGKFVISGIPAGSYVVYAHHPDIYFQGVRVEIAGNGKIRARILNHIRPSEVLRLPYPLELKPLMRRKYFRNREQWSLLDYILSPMVLLMVLPLLMMLLLTQLITDPETKREIENIQFPQIPHEIPDLSDVLTSLLTGKKLELTEKKAPAIAANKKRN